MNVFYGFGNIGILNSNQIVYTAKGGAHLVPLGYLYAVDERNYQI